MYIRTDGQAWEVEARTGGGAGRSKVYPCPGRQSAEILAGAWMDEQHQWRLVAPCSAGVDAPRNAGQPGSGSVSGFRSADSPARP